MARQGSHGKNHLRRSQVRKIKIKTPTNVGVLFLAEPHINIVNKTNTAATKVSTIIIVEQPQPLVSSVESV